MPRLWLAAGTTADMGRMGQRLCAPMATTGITPMIARRTAITALIGFMTDSLSAPGLGLAGSDSAGAVLTAGSVAASVVMGLGEADSTVGSAVMGLDAADSTAGSAVVPASVAVPGSAVVAASVRAAVDFTEAVASTAVVVSTGAAGATVVVDTDKAQS